MPYYTSNDDDVDDFNDYDPTPYSGGYDITVTYGRSVPPSDETCYPRSGDAFEYQRPVFSSSKEPAAYGDQALNTEYSSYARPKTRPGGHGGAHVEGGKKPEHGGSGSDFGRKPDSGGTEVEYGRRPESGGYGGGRTEVEYGRKPESEHGSAGYGHRKDEDDDKKESHKKNSGKDCDDEKSMKSLLGKMKQYKVRAMADIVINHRIGTTRGHGGMYNRYDGSSLPWDEHAVTSCTGGKGNRSTGDNFNGVPNVDHTQHFVRKDIIGWLRWLRNTVGFQDFRFDFARGYSAQYVKEYIGAAKPLFSVGECWDSCNYNGHGLDYNQDSHRQRIINWIDATGQRSAAFDFTTKGILQEAVMGQYWRLRDAQGKPPGVMGWWPSRAVTFLDNHDTGSTQAHWPFPSHHIMEGYAYILTHPGIPCVFYDHFYDWGSSIHDQIVKLIDVRRRQDIHSRSTIRILEAKSNLYAAIVGEKLCMKLGDASWCPSGREWTLATSGHRYAVWHK